jgi:hypothetical protein
MTQSEAKGKRVDLTVYERSRIARLPKIARGPALFARNVRDIVLDSFVMKRLYGFVYHSDGMATVHYSPFLENPRFSAAYEQMVSWWRTDGVWDNRWRMWFLTQCAEQCRALSGSFVEFGAYRGGCAFMILAMADLEDDQRFYLFDTFGGIPESNLTESERDAGFGGRLADTSVAHIQSVLARWCTSIVTVKGDIFDTLPGTETGPVAFCHLDLNASAPTLRALEYVYSRLLPSGMIVMDDYTQREYDDQRLAVDAFFADKPERPLALPTGQGLIVKI